MEKDIFVIYFFFFLKFQKEKSITFQDLNEYDSKNHLVLSKLFREHRGLKYG